MRPGTVLAIVGVTFYQDAVTATSVGDTVSISHDADNEYDPNAAVIKDTAGNVLGHLPRNLAPRFTNPANGGDPDCRWAATITNKTHYENTEGLRITLGTQIQPLPA